MFLFWRLSKVFGCFVVFLFAVGRFWGWLVCWLVGLLVCWSACASLGVALVCLQLFTVSHSFPRPFPVLRSFR